MTPIRRGFTLIEILAALGILAIGLSAVLAMVLGSTRISYATSDRNSATLAITDAMADIERLHLITSDTVAQVGGSSAHVGLYIATSEPAAGWPSIHATPYANVTAYGGLLNQYVGVPPNDVSVPPNTMIWPPSPDPRFYGGPFREKGAGGTSSGAAFRAIYRLERHPDWQANDASPYNGVYVLTLAVYRDIDQQKPPADTTKRYEQVTDPVVVYLRQHG